MSVEDIQRVNNLAQQLLNQGICSDRQEAVQQAEKMLNKNLAKQQDVSSQNTVSQGSDENLRMLFDRFRDYTQKQMMVFRQDLQALHEEIKLLKSSNAKVIKHEAPRQDVRECSSEKSSDPHPKKGNFKSDDVSIEKMFYYGNK